MDLHVQKIKIFFLTLLLYPNEAIIKTNKKNKETNEMFGRFEGTNTERKKEQEIFSLGYNDH